MSFLERELGTYMYVTKWARLAGGYFWIQILLWCPPGFLSREFNNFMLCKMQANCLFPVGILKVVYVQVAWTCKLYYLFTYSFFNQHHDTKIMYQLTKSKLEYPPWEPPGYIIFLAFSFSIYALGWAKQPFSCFMMAPFQMANAYILNSIFWQKRSIIYWPH